MAYKELKTRIKWCRDTSANWTSNNPVLLDGEIIVVDTGSGETRFKIGDGVKTYTQLPFEDEAVRNLINNKVDKVDGQGLSTNDYTTDEKEKLASIEAGAQVNVQADWEQNDDTSDSYINNRPFYVMGTVEVTLLDGTFEFKQANDTVYANQQNVTFYFEIGKEYTVIFDGTSYTCVAYDGGGVSCLGNGAIMAHIFTDTGEPFVMITPGDALNVGTTLTDASHTITIKINEENIKKIDQKYIPDLNYLSKVSPVGIGSFSLNRKANTTVGDCSFAEGLDTTASGSYSHAEGFNTDASGSCSHAEGMYTQALSENQHVQGISNIGDLDGTYAHIVGNGIPERHSNAHTLDWSGNAWFQGDVYTGSTSGTNKDAGSKKLATEEYVDNSIDAVLPKSGGTMTGALTLAADPANDLEAATKQYVDTLNSSSQNTWYGTCTTAAATAAKVVTTTTGNFTLKDGATVYVLFNTAHTSTSRITLNVDGTGDIAVNLSSTNGMTAYQIAAKQVICFVYDGESFRVQGGSLATTQYYGLTKLSSSTSSTATNMAATPSAVKEAYDLAVAALPQSGGTMTGTLTAQNNTDYTTKQVRNVFLIAEGDSIPSGSNGDICLIYTP